MRFPVFLFPTILLLASCVREDEPSPSPTPDPEGGESVFVSANRWIYASMNRDYLWREDMPDSTQCDYSKPPIDFFNSLLSDKDRFSYMFNNPDYNEGNTEFNLGFEGQLCKDNAGREAFRVDYITSKSAGDAGLRRGNYVEIISHVGNQIVLQRLSIDGKGQFKSGSLNVIKYAILPGEESSTVLCHKILRIDNHCIGYMCYLEYDSTADFMDAMREFKSEGIETLILDLRYNPGGYVSTCAFLGACIGSEKVPGSIFQICTYNDRYSSNLEKDTGSRTSLSYFPGAPNPSDLTLIQPIIPLTLPKIYVITSTRTASASEAEIICLRPYMEVVQIGETTVGKGVGSWSITDPKYKYGLQPITMRYHNALGETTPETGLVPEFQLENVISSPRGEMGDPDEPILNATLEIIVTGQYNPSSAGIRRPQMTQMPEEIGEPTYIRKFRSRQGRPSYISNCNKIFEL